MTHSSDPSTKSKNPQSSSARMPAQPSGRGGQGIVPASFETADSSGLFRDLLVCCFEGLSQEATIGEMGNWLKGMLVERRRFEPETQLQQRLEALSADLIFLAKFLSTEVDTRVGSTVAAEEWELLRAAGHVGAQLMRVRERLLGAVVLEPERVATVSRWDELWGCRETALWRVGNDDAAEILRTLGACLVLFARKVQEETKSDHPSTSRKIRGAIVDLRHLADFALETSTLAPADLAEQLDELSGYLTAAAQRLGEEDRVGPDLGDLRKWKMPCSH